MKSQQTPCSISKVIGLSDHVIDFIKGPAAPPPLENTPEPVDNIKGGVLTDLRYSWLTNRARLEVLHTKTGQKIAAWSFRDMMPNICISCVVDVPSQSGKAPYLVVGLEHWLSPKEEFGTVCVFDLSSSRVLRAIHFDDRVTSVHVVSVSSDASLPGALRALDGIIAVGTKNGKIFLVDLCRQACDEAAAATHTDDSECARDEQNPCQLVQVSVQDVKRLEQFKEMALQSGDHLCIQLNELCTDTDVVILKTPKGGHKVHVNKEEVTISALSYCPQLGALLVGYNFGAFQLYNLLTVRLEYTSPVYEDCTPVTHFAVQEPCDDPRAFCYVWVMYSAEKAGAPGYPMAVMYALAYNTKEYLEGYGHLYQELVSCSVRFQTDLTTMAGSKITAPYGARCISLRGHTRTIVNKVCTAQHIGDVHEDNLAVCSVVWTVRDQHGATTDTYLCLFDLNQWYKEQMPSTPRADHTASYMVYVCLSQLFRPASDYNGPLLDVRIDTASLNQFISAQRLEEHYYPSALAFKCVSVREEDIVWFGSAGAQRHLLSCIELAGPLCLMRPTDLFHQCISLGLAPLYTDVAYNWNTPLNLQREMMLNVCLEQQLVCWLCRCAVDWSNGSQASAGCTLDFLLKWAWQRANTLKHSANKLCVPLFDYSGMRLDANALVQLNHCTCQLKHLATVFSTVVTACVTFLSSQDVDEIKQQLRMLQMIAVYFEVLQWLLNVGLLPECHLTMYPRMDESERISAPYPADSLERFYHTRRAELRELQPNQRKQAADSCELLFIDQLIDLECGGAKLRRQWEDDGGRGLYPPPSLQALLRTYLLEDIDIVHKHCLFIYVFLDLAMTLDQSRYKPVITHLIKFPAVFKLSPSIIKITQAFWQLDHGDFSTAMTQLLDTSLDAKDLRPWHHRTVLKSLLLQGQNQHALLYQQVRKPPASHIQDMCIVTTLFVVNDMLQEAFHYQRQNRTIYNEQQLLKHFFQVCDKIGQLASVIQLPLSPLEEAEFIQYLKGNPSEMAENLLVIYYLQRDRYSEAFDMNDQLNNNAIAQQGLLGQRERTFRNVVVQGFKKTLPAITQTLLDYCKAHRHNNRVNDDDVAARRPIPMSVLIHDSKQQATYKSTLIQTSLMKARETWIPQQHDRTTNELNETPFISTPRVLPADRHRHVTPVIYPAVVYPVNITQLAADLDDDDNEPTTPAKKMRLSPRQTFRPAASSALHDDEHSSGCQQLEQLRRRLSCVDSLSSLLDTPIVKRKSYRSMSRETDRFSIGTPTSILKVRSLLRSSVSPDTNDDSLRGSTSTTPEQLEHSGMDTDNGFVSLDYNTTRPASTTVKSSISVSLLGQRKSSLGVSPRKPIQRTPRPAVRFEDASKRASTEHMEVEIPIEIIREKTREVAVHVDSKNSCRSAEETFYSLSTSCSDSSAQQQQTDVEEPRPLTPEPLTPKRSALKRKASDSSVKSRRSYKSNIPVEAPALRLTRSRKSINLLVDDTTANKLVSEDTSHTTTTTSNNSTANNNNNNSEPLPARKKTESLLKIGGRRSLARQVLEQNTLVKALSTPLGGAHATPSSSSRPPDTQQLIGYERSCNTSTTTIETRSRGNVSEESVRRSTSELKDRFSSARDPDTAAHVIRHVHNESNSKSAVHKVTELLDEDCSLASVNILSGDSDMDESFLQRRYVSEQTPATAGADEDGDRDRDSVLEQEFRASVPVSESTVCEEESPDSAAVAAVLLRQQQQPPVLLADDSDMLVITDISEDIDNEEEEQQQQDSKYQSMAVQHNTSTSAASPLVSARASIRSVAQSSTTSAPSARLEALAASKVDTQREQEQTVLQDAADDNAKVSDQSDGMEVCVDYQSESEQSSSSSQSAEQPGAASSSEESDEQQAEDDEEDVDVDVELVASGADEDSKPSSSSEEKSSNEEDEYRDNRRQEPDNNCDEAEHERQQNSNNESDESSEVIEIKSSSDDESLETLALNQSAVQEALQASVQDAAGDLDVQEEVIVAVAVDEDDDEVVHALEVSGIEADINVNTCEQDDPSSGLMMTAPPSLVSPAPATSQPSDQGQAAAAAANIPTDEIDSEQIVAPDSELEVAEPLVCRTDLSLLTTAGTGAGAGAGDENQAPVLDRTDSSSSSKISDASTIPYIPRDDAAAGNSTSSNAVNPEPKPPVRTSTRRRSSSTQPQQAAAAAADASAAEDTAPVAAAKYYLRDKSADKQPERQKRARRAASVSSAAESTEAQPATQRRTRRSVSVDATDVAAQPVRTRRGSSVDSEPAAATKPVDTAAGGKWGRRRSSVQAEVIIEEREEPTSTLLQQIPERIEEYSATHRLTRRQKAIMEKSMELQQIKRLEQKTSSPNVGRIDPMNLMDKESFSGEPDMDERHLRQASPTSSVDTQSSVTTRSSARLRTKHHHSPGSDTAETPGTPKRKRGGQLAANVARSVDSASSSQPAADGRPRRRSFTMAQQAIVTPTRPRTRRTRLTSQDTDVSDASSVMSVPVVPVVQLHKLPDIEIQRHRSLSPTMLQAEKDAVAAPVATSSKNRRKSTRASGTPLRRELSKISEETGSNASEVVERKDTEPGAEEEEEEVGNMRGRNTRKSMPRDATQSSHKPPAHYLPKYTATKSRKSFKIVRKPMRRHSPPAPE